MPQHVNKFYIQFTHILFKIYYKHASWQCGKKERLNFNHLSAIWSLKIYSARKNLSILQPHLSKSGDTSLPVKVLAETGANSITDKHSFIDRRIDGETWKLHGSKDKKGDGHEEEIEWAGMKRHDRHATDTGRQESRLGWGRHYVRPPFTVLHLPLTTFRANKSWFLSSLFPRSRLSSTLRFLPFVLLLLALHFLPS